MFSLHYNPIQAFLDDKGWTYAQKALPNLTWFSLQYLFHLLVKVLLTNFELQEQTTSSLSTVFLTHMELIFD